jgi:hypothetical protein
MVETSRWTTVASASGSTRPKPGDGGAELSAAKLPLMACGQLAQVPASSARFNVASG